MSVSGWARSKAHSFLKQSGISIGKVDLVDFSFLIALITSKTLRDSGLPAGRKVGSLALSSLLYSRLTAIANTLCLLTVQDFSLCWQYSK